MISFVCMSEVSISKNLFTKNFDSDFVLNKWVPALRSGEFKQGKGALKAVDPLGNAEHCCLGVACELADLPMVELTPRQRERFPDIPSQFTVYTIKGDVELGVSQKLAQKIGLRDAYGDFTEGGSVVGTMLPTLNDEDNFTFNDIADVIERHAKARLAERGV